MGPVGIFPQPLVQSTELRHAAAVSTITEAALPTLDRNATRLKFAPDADGFLSELKRRIDGYFTRTGKSPNDCWQMYLKTAIIMAGYLSSYILLVFFAQGPLQAISLAIVLAVSMAAIGFSIQHDGGHNAYSRYRTINKIAAWSLDLIGVSSYLWYWKHAIFHHTYTNVQGHDTDIDLGAAGRFSPHAKKYWFQRYQHIYLWAAYGLMSSRWHLFGDFRDLVAGNIPPHKYPRPKGWDLVLFFTGKIYSLAVAFAIPIMAGHEWWVVLLFYFMITSIIGVALSIVFQLAHCVEEADFPLPIPGTVKMENAWAVHQIETTVDFARTSWSLCWLLGGLNFQIEHHLFPKVCHIHYPAISKIVEGTCKEYGIRYAVHPTFWAGMKSHYRWLKRMGAPDPVTPQATSA